jgi:hypothetical protein
MLSKKWVHLCRVVALLCRMELCPRTLAQALESGPLPVEECWHVLRGILLGLNYIHEVGGWVGRMAVLMTHSPSQGQ